MIERTAVAGAVALALLVAQAAPAQLVSRLEAGAVTTVRDGLLPERAISLAPALRFESPYFGASAEGTAWRTATDWQIQRGDLRLRASSPTFFRLRAQAEAVANRLQQDPGAPSDQLSGQVRVSMPFRHGGVWVGGGIERPLGIVVASTVDVSGAGGWTEIGRTTITGSITNFNFTRLASMSDSASGADCARAASQVPTNLGIDSEEWCWRRSQFRDLQGGIQWSSALLEVSAHGGYRFGSAFDVSADSRRYGSVTASYWLTENIAAVLGHARQPASPARGLPARSLSHFGVMVAYSPVPRRVIPVAVRSMVAGFELREARAGERTIVIRAAGIESVEIMGDFTDWEPRALTRYGRDHWEITLPIPAGVREINVRLDHGKWRSPPGVPTRRDGFNGEVGIIVVE